MKPALSKLIPASLQPVVVPIIISLVSIILFIFLAKFGVDKVREQQRQLTSAKTIEKTLTEKRDILTKVQDQATQLASVVSLALPSQNPSFAVISQLRAAASGNSVSIGNLKIGGEIKDKNGFSKEEVDFSLTGSFPQIVGYLRGLSSVSPLLSVEKVKISQKETLLKAEVVSFSFWASFPQNLPPIDAPITDLTQNEKDLLTKIGSFKTPLFSEITPQPPSQRLNPFGL